LFGIYYHGTRKPTNARFIETIDIVVEKIEKPKEKYTEEHAT